MAKGKNVTVALTGQSTIVFQGSANARSFRPLPDGHPCYALVGRVAAQTARIEKMLDQAICDVAQIDLKVGASITGQMIGHVPRFNALFQLATNRDMSETIRKRIKATQGRGGPHFERRHRALHDPWLEDVDTGAPHQDRGKAKTDPTFGPQPVSEQELRDMLGELAKYRREVTDLVSDIWIELHSS